MNERIVRKVKHLLALSKSSNEHEAQNAMLKVQALLMKYKLSMADVECYEYEKINIEEKIAEGTFTKAKWKVILACVLAENLGCYSYVKRNRTNYVAFFGREDDVAVCEITYSYALDSIKREVGKLKRMYSKHGLSTKGLESDYALGFARGLYHRFEEQKKKHQEWGLVLVKDKKVMEAYQQKEAKMKKDYDARTKFNGNLHAYEIGEQHGKDFCITNKIASNEDESLMLCAPAI